MSITIPAQNIAIQTKEGVIEPIWYEKLKLIAAAFGAGKLPNNATNGFMFLPTVAGPPSGIPVARPGYAAAVFDTSNNKLWIYNGTWLGVVVS